MCTGTVIKRFSLVKDQPGRKPTNLELVKVLAESSQSDHLAVAEPPTPPWSCRVRYTDAAGDDNTPFARSGHMVRNKLCWDSNNVMGLSKQRNSYQFCFESPTALFASEHNSDSVPCDRIVQRAYWDVR